MTMTHDTSKDPRLLMVGIALEKLKKVLVLKLGIRPKLSKEETKEHMKKMEGNLMTCKYMYIPPEELAEQETLLEIVRSANAILESLGEVLSKKDANPSIKADLFWIFQTLIGLPKRLKRGGDSMASGVDLMVVKVRNVVKKDKLWMTRVDNGRRELTVVTNMPGIESGMVLAVAFLPPTQLADTFSEAMFLGKEQRKEGVGDYITDTGADVKEAAGILHREVSKN